MRLCFLVALMGLGLLAGCSSNKPPSAPENLSAPPPAAAQALRPPQASK
ncbi:MAG: hypothetical protein QM758_08885 [Armatimonas sp.]